MTVMASTPDNSAAGEGLTARDLTCVRGRRTLVDGLDLALEPGRPVHLVGENGSGKTTLLRTLAGLRPAERGSIHWRGEPVEGQRGEFLQALTFIGHDAGLKHDLTPRENLAAIIAIAGLEPGEPVDATLAALGLAGLADRPVRKLSAGQARRVVLARLRLAPTPLWILDEPFTALDADGRTIVRDLLLGHCRAGGLALITSHQPVDFGDIRVDRIQLGGVA